MYGLKLYSWSIYIYSGVLIPFFGALLVRVYRGSDIKMIK